MSSGKGIMLAENYNYSELEECLKKYEFVILGMSSSEARNIRAYLGEKRYIYFKQDCGWGEELCVEKRYSDDL